LAHWGYDITAERPDKIGRGAVKASDSKLGELPSLLTKHPLTTWVKVGRITFVKMYEQYRRLGAPPNFQSKQQPIKLYEYEKATNLKSSAYRAHRNLDSYRIVNHRQHLQSMVG
jgi:hypothetical protein